MVHLELRISLRIFEKNRNSSPNGILKRVGNCDYAKSNLDLTVDEAMLLEIGK